MGVATYIKDEKDAIKDVCGPPAINRSNSIIWAKQYLGKEFRKSSEKII